VDLPAIHRIARALADSRRPALVVGHRALFPDCSNEIEELVLRCGLPVATSVVAKGIVDEAQPLCLGVLNLFGHRAADRYLRDADCVIAVGESFMENTCNYYERELVPPGGVIHIDSDISQMGRVYPMETGAAGNIRASLRALADRLHSMEYAAPVDPAQIARLKLDTEHFAEAECSCSDTPIKPQRFFTELESCFPPEALLQVDIGQNFFWSLRYFKAPRGRYFGTWGFKPMGVGAAGAVGLSLARPDATVICVCGDGSMQMNGMELGTAVNYNLPIVWVVFNDGRLNMVHMAQGISYQERYVASTMKNPDFVAWARAFGARGYRVVAPGHIGEAIGRACEQPGPAVVELHIDPEELPPLKPRSLLMAREMGLNVADSPVASRAFRKVLDER